MTYIRTEQHRKSISERNSVNKRKYPNGFDCKSRLYRIWKCMYFRCYQENHKAYKNYGGRGINICNDWINNYSNFMNWALLNGYSEDLTLDRINNDKGYYPDNCRWATMLAQQNHRRNNVLITAFGETKTISEWHRDDRCSISITSLHKRLRDNTLDFEWSITAKARSDVRAVPFTQERKDKIANKAKLRNIKRNSNGQFLPK